jgi:hypothetical protein
MSINPVNLKFGDKVYKAVFKPSLSRKKSLKKMKMVLNGIGMIQMNNTKLQNSYIVGKLLFKNMGMLDLMKIEKINIILDIPTVRFILNLKENLNMKIVGSLLKKK